jgi:AAA domain
MSTESTKSALRLIVEKQFPETHWDPNYPRPGREQIDGLEPMFLTNYPIKPSLVDGLMPSKGIVILYGSEGSFKSYVALDLCFHIALGWRWIGRPVTQGDIVYVGAEDPQGLALRRDAWRRYHSSADPLQAARHFKPLKLRPDFSVRNSPEARRLIDQVGAAMPAIRLIVIDTATAVAGGFDLNPPHSEAIIRNCEDIAAGLNATVLLVSHPNKGQEKILTGGGAFGRAAENLWSMRHKPGTPFSTMEVVGKAKTVGVVGERFRFGLEYVDFPDMFEHGHRIRSSCVSHREQLPDRKAVPDQEGEKPGVVQEPVQEPEKKASKTNAERQKLFRERRRAAKDHNDRALCATGA